MFLTMATSHNPCHFSCIFIKESKVLAVAEPGAVIQYLRWELVFLPKKSGRKSYREIWDFETSRFPGNLCRDPGNFFYLSKGFSGTDIYHSDLKNRLLQIKTFFCSLKILFQNSENF